MDAAPVLSSSFPRLAFRVAGTSLKIPGRGGVLSTIINRAKGGSSVESKCIVVYQSIPFKPAERGHIIYPDEPVYRSEELDGNNDDISPSLTAIIKCPIDKDCEIRVDIVHAGVATNGREVIICSKAFFLADLIRKLKDVPSCVEPSEHRHLGRSYVAEMESQYCSGARLYVELADGFKPILCHPSFLPIAPETPKNPLQQQYVFYSEDDYSSPIVYAEEYALEPRIGTKLPIIFLENAISMLMRSTGAWRARRDLEAMRQGCFASRREAFRCGWHEVTVSVLGAKLSDAIAAGKTSAASSAVSGKGRAGQGPGYPTYVPMNLDEGHLVCNVDADDVDSDAEDGNVAADFGATRSKDKIAKVIKSAGKTLVLGAKAAASASASAAISVASSVRRSTRVDESKPCTYVEVSIEDSSAVFADVIGRTNTEYFTTDPAYGSNLNLGHGTAISKKPQGDHTSAGLATVITQPKDYRFGVCANNASEGSGATTTASTAGTVDVDLINFTDSPVKPAGVCSANLAGGDDEFSIPGYVAAFVRYVPRRKHTLLKFSLYFIEDAALEGSKKSPPKLLGQCSVPLGEADVFDGWLPLKVDPLDPFGALFSSKDMQVRVRMQIVSPDPPRQSMENDASSAGVNFREPTTPYIAPASFPTGICPIRKHDGSSVYNLEDRLRLRAASSPRAAALTIDYEEVLSACYDWLWPLGFRGLDPLVIESSATVTKPGSASTSNSASTSAGKSGKNSVFSVAPQAQSGTATTSPFSPLAQANDCSKATPNSSSNVVDLLSFDDDNSTAADSVPSYPPVPDLLSLGEHSPAANLLSPLAQPTPLTPSSIGYETYPRADCAYPLTWLDRHVSALESLGEDLRGLLTELRDMHAEGSTFRSSCMKKLMPMQIVPINIHMQVMAVRRHHGYTQDRSYPEGVIDAISCGSMAPHGLGYKKGGLDAQENALAAAKARLDKLKVEYAAAVETAKGCISPEISAGNLREQLCRDALEFESSLVTIGQRRLFAVSQAVSIAASALMMKLTLVAEGMIPAEAALGWLRNGFPIVFEGLLSVILNERAMIEDTVSAVEGLRLYQFRIIPTPDDLTYVDATIQGREVQLLFPAAALDALPSEFSRQAHAGGAVITIFPVLFTQGIDMQQSLALAATATASAASAAASAAAARVGAGFASIAGSSSTKSNSSTTSEAPTGVGADSSPTVLPPESNPSAAAEIASSNDYQRSINVKALALLHEYCLRAKPLNYELEIGAALLEKLSLQTASTKKAPPSQAAAGFVPASSPPQAESQIGGHVRQLSATTSRTFGALTSIASSAASIATSKYKAFASGGGASSSTALPPEAADASSPVGGRTSPVPSSVEPAVANKVALIHPMLRELAETIVGNVAMWKNVDMLVAVERAVVMLDGCRVTFCKSGKDRTGMVVTYEQSRQLGERFGCGTSQQRILRDANTMRIHGTRILVAEKNIGRRVYSINKLQVQFLPLVYRPPNSVLEDLLRKDDVS